MIADFISFMNANPIALPVLAGIVVGYYILISSK